ncbi:hypoxanthine phosphoribosyltransferase 1 [Cichlidogyrus casuarinus]|uniref:Hypoxanthine phosphoribosyltransferase n=1 Tax=Cichlidogyrus casuarinus TaxID=1844966 RepID=A0ABD2Q6K2_9PLAT
MTSKDNFIIIKDDPTLYDPELFMISPVHKQYVDKILIPCGLIHDRTARLAIDIVNYYSSQNIKSVHVVCILLGSYLFYNEVIEAAQDYINCRQIDLNLFVHFVRLQSYVDDRSENEVKIIGEERFDFAKENHVLVIEDIVDTGKTMAKFTNTLSPYKPNSLEIASLLLKRTPLSSGFKPRFVGFEVPDLFVIGYGLDYNEHFRTLQHICTINEHGKTALSVSKH